MTQSLRIIFAGTPDFAARHLQALLASQHSVIAVYSQPDRPAGRGQQLQPSAVKQLALEHKLPVYQPKSLKTNEAQAELVALNADIMIVVAYGLILPQNILDAPKYGCLNVHGSILPRWRGAAPIQRAIWAGDTETGVTIMQMDAGLDTGDMLSISRCPISNSDTSASLYDTLALLGPAALIDTLNNLTSQQQQAVKQDNNLATYAHKLSKDEAELDFTKTAQQLDREIRAFNPWPVSYIKLQQGTVKVWHASTEPLTTAASPGQILTADKQGIRIACQDSVLNITQLQPPGKKSMLTADFLNGRADWLAPGMIIQPSTEKQL
ncbi:methionyl-tRNA formyltransferase [Rheinheimera sp. MMS21-TC3]|uniref:methionyl-tRNA formyltransferase n=1 Tax=Rheinheimera sp. MMS21-TC3 TaxID=3072790 RepID=UPI0028C478E7|nr:methionyl-tRNA formyltransferase [Rheinheimera sp. MMS21-TC3]WNO59702.1 methionyl-tRNA formyltransferase [Rheinheimera sp. MMS21-TC3]